MDFLKLKIHQNPFSAGDPPRTLLRELTTLAQTPSWLGGRHPLHIPIPSPPIDLAAFGASLLTPTSFLRLTPTLCM